MSKSDGGSTPDQYELPEGATELQDLIEWRDMNFALGNIFKAAYRMGTKNNDMYELKKIQWFIDREIKRRESERVDYSAEEYHKFAEALRNSHP